MMSNALRIVFAGVLLTPCMSEWALLNIIRHGERSLNKSDIHLTIDGYHRAAYLARCVGAPEPNLAFPNGHPTKLLASRREGEKGKLSVRPQETLKPLGKKLGLKVITDVEMADLDGFDRYVQRNLTAGETWLVAWQHWFIPLLAKTMDPNGLAEQHFPFPSHCNYTEWTEPDYINGKCYDLLVQLVLVRAHKSKPWRIQAFTDMHMGFGGSPDSPCASAFVPHSNPTGWRLATGGRGNAGPGAANPTEDHDNGIMEQMQQKAMVGIMVGICALILLLVLQTFTCKSARMQRFASSHYEHLLATTNAEANEGHASQSKSTRRGSLLTLSAIFILFVTLLFLTGIMRIDMHALRSVGKTLPLAFLFNLCTGGFVGALAKTISAPVERVKLLIQTQDTIPNIASGEMPRYEGMIDCFARVYREQGLLAFWRGNFPNVLRYFPIAAFNFAFKDAIEGFFPKYDPSTQFMQLLLVNLASGGLAGAGSLTLVYPLDLARTKLAGDVGKDSWKEQTDCASSRKRQFEGLMDCFMKTARSEGFFVLYKGYTVSVIGIIMYRAPYFGLFDTINAFNPFTTNGIAGLSILGLLTSFFVAQITSAIATFVSYPFDAVRRRLQMEAEKRVEDKMYKGAFHCAYSIIIEEGVSGFYKGFTANLIRGASTAFMLVLFKEVTGLAGTD